MKTTYIFLLLIAFTNFTFGQDTIFMKSGDRLLSRIIEKGDVEVKYKKYDQPEPAGIYSAFISDIIKIHYSNGTVIDFTKSPQSNYGESDKKPAIESSEPVMKFNVGMTINYLIRNENDDLREFWRYINIDENLEMAENPWSMSVNLGMCAALDRNKRNWFGASTQITLTPPDAISSSFDYGGGINEIRLGYFRATILMGYGHTIGLKKNVIFIVDGGIAIGNMNGTITIGPTSYEVSSLGGLLPHFDTGLDVIISRRILANFRTGYQFMKIEEVHKSSASSTGYTSFYVNHTINDDLVNVKWNGPYFSLGISFSMYAKIPTGRPE